MSKWFSESGKLVQRLFTHVLELVEDETCFVVVLIDEVESLTAARAGAMSGKEPSDAVRVCYQACEANTGLIAYKGRQCLAHAAGQAQEQEECARHDHVKSVRRNR